MPRNVAGVFSKPPNTTAVPNEVIRADRFNSVIDDFASEANAVRPVTAGGTGVSSLTDLRLAMKAIPYLSAGDDLPTENVGPVFHADYGFEVPLVWQTFNQNGASYNGYASANIGRSIMDDAHNRAGWVLDEGGVMSKSGIGRALWNWALNYNLVVPLGSWTAGPIVFADAGSGNFKLPDQRDMFWRGRGSGREFGAYQGDDFASHNHGGSIGSNGSHSHSGSTTNSGNHSHSGSTDNDTHNHTMSWEEKRAYSAGGTLDVYGPGSGDSRDTDNDTHNHSLNISGAGNHNHSLNIYNAGNHSHSLTINNSGGSETRPVNISKHVMRKL